MNKLFNLAVGLLVVGAANADPILGHSEISDFSWDSPSGTTSANFDPFGNYATFGLHTIINLSDYSIVDVETFVAKNSASAIIKEIAGNANLNSFGWYEVGGTKTEEIFNGAASAGASKISYFGSASEVGFYLATPKDGVFYTEKSKNPDLNQQVIIFQSNTEENEFILAWEDLDRTKLLSPDMYSNVLTKQDSDFNDFVVKVRFDVPEPATLSFIGLSLLSLSGLSFVRRKRS